MSIPKILIVDDEREILDLLHEELQELGYETQLATNGHEAMQKINSNSSFDMIISDYRMGPGNGLFLLERVNELDRETRPDFIFITGHADITEEEAMEKGAKAFYLKPFDLEEFVGTVQTFLMRRLSSL